MSNYVPSRHYFKIYLIMTKRKKENEMNLSQIVDEAALILQRKSDNVMTNQTGGKLSWYFCRSSA